MKRRRIFQKSIVYVLALCFFMTGVIGTNKMVGKAEAASFYCTREDGDLSLNETCHIRINDAKKGAKYTYFSSNKKVAPITKKGAITGKKVGKAKITVKETYKGKTKKIGTMLIMVYAPTIRGEWKNENTIIGQTGYWESKRGKEEGKKYFGAERVLMYQNRKATYKVYSSDSDKLKVKTNGTIEAVNGEGKVTLTVKETYEEKTKTIGSFKVNVAKPYLTDETVLLNPGDDFIVAGHIEKHRDYVSVFKEEMTTEEELKKDWERLAQMKEKGEKVPVLKNDIFENDPEDPNQNNEFIARKSGTRYLYYGIRNYENNTYETLGYIVVTIIGNDKANKVSMMWDKIEGIYNTETGYEMEAGQDAYLNLYTEPYRYEGDFTVDIEDTSIVSCEKVYKSALVSIGGEWDENGVLILHPKKPGVTTVTVHADGASNTFKVNVYAPRTYKTNDWSSVTFYSILDQKDLVEKSGEKGWRFESSDPEIASIRDYSGGEYIFKGETQVIMLSDAYFDTHEKEGEATISAYYNDKLVGQTTIHVE